jgi:DNA-binding transcriptional LysR family regulator
MLHATLQQLRLFAAVARNGSFTRAAEEVHLTQPAVSIQVKRLEERVGLALFEHVGRALHLTVAGQEVFAACRDVLGRLDDLETALGDLQTGIAGPLKVTVISSGKYFLPHLLGTFVRRHPKVEPKLEITNRAKLLARLEANEDDLYIMGRVPEGLQVEEYPFLENVVVAVARPDHPLAKERSIPLARFVAEPYVGREQGSGTRKAVETVLAEHGLSVEPYIELDSAEAIKHGVMGGLGVAALSLHALRLELAAGELAILDVEAFPLRRQWYAVHRKGKRLSRAAQTFLDYLQNEGEAEVAHLLAEAPSTTSSTALTTEADVA